MSFAAFMDDFASNCDDLEAFCDAVAKYDVQFDSVLLSLLDRIAQVIKSVQMCLLTTVLYKMVGPMLRVILPHDSL